MAIIALDRAFIETESRKVALLSRLAATVEIRTGTRRIISYLLSPLQTTVSQAGRER